MTPRLPDELSECPADYGMMREASNGSQ